MLGELLEMLADGLGTTSTNRSRSKSSCRHCGKIAFLVIAGIVGAVIYFQPQLASENIVKAEAKSLCHDDNFVAEGKDTWDNDLQYATKEIQDPIATECTVTSAGRDGKFGTSDDIIAQNRNLHVSKIVGKEIGAGAKQFFKGVMDGLTSKDEQTTE